MLTQDKKLEFSEVLIKPRPSELASRSDVNLKVAYICKHSKRQIRGCPVIVSNLDSTGTIEMARITNNYGMFVCLHKYIEMEDLTKWFVDIASQRSFVTIGTSTGEIDKIKHLSEYVDNFKPSYFDKICIDAPNGYTYEFLDMIKYVRTLFPHKIIMAGNVCDPIGVENIIKAGADIAKCGIASGGLCTTKYKTGIGYPQFSVALECGQAAQELNALCCSDGGVQHTADICKALGAGSHFVMAGSLFTGYDECNAEVVDGKQKVYGMSSKEANDKYNGGLREYRAAEGMVKYVEQKGSVLKLVGDICGGLASCCTYTNTKNLENLHKNCTFIRV